MALSNAYLFQVKNLSQILKAIREAQAPDRFTYSFLEALGFKSTNDRGIIGVLKALGFIDESGNPKQPYFDYLDDERSKAVLAEGIRRAYADLFKLNNKANEKDVAWVKNKLRTLTQGSKGDAVLNKMALTFVALCKESDFQAPSVRMKEATDESINEEPVTEEIASPDDEQGQFRRGPFSLAYNINIELPAVRDQAVYDAIFKSLRENLF
jgi:hypothetical protein